MSWSSIIKREDLESVDVGPFTLPDFSGEVPAGSVMLPEAATAISTAPKEAGRPAVEAEETPPAVEGAFQVKEEIPTPPAPAPQPPVELSEELKRKLFEQGYEQGQRVGQELAEKKLEPVLDRFEQAIQELSELRGKIIRRSERNIADLAIEISQKIIQRELSLDREVLVGMIRSALADFGEQDEITIRVRPEDHQYLSTAKPGIVEGGEGIKNIVLQADESISEGGCVIEADFGKIDLRIDKQLEEISRSMGVEGGEEKIETDSEESK